MMHIFMLSISSVAMVGVLTLRSRTREDAYAGLEQWSGNSIQVSGSPISNNVGVYMQVAMPLS